MQSSSASDERSAVLRTPGRFAKTHFRVLTAAIAIAGALLNARSTRVGGFRHDDFSQIGLGQDYGFSSTMLFAKPKFFEHLVPGSNVLSWLIGIFGPEWWMAQWFAAACVATLVVLVAVLVLRITGSALVALISAVAVATSTVYISLALWWTATTLQLPMLCFAAATLLLSLVWIESRSRWVFAGAVLAQIAACSFYDRAQILPFAVFALLAVATPSDHSFTATSFRRRTIQSAPIVFALLLVAVIQLAITVSKPGLHTGILTTVSSISISDWLVAVADWWTIGVGSTLWNRFPLTLLPFLNYQQSTLAITAGLGALALLAVATIRGRRSAYVWASVVVLITLSGLQIAALRLETVTSASIASMPRYQEMTVLVLAVFVPAGWAAAGKPRPRRKAAGALLAMFVAGSFVVWIVNLRAGIHQQQVVAASASSYAKNFRQSLIAWNSNGLNGTILDQQMPPSVLAPVPQTEDYGYYSKAKRILAPGIPSPPFDSLAGIPLQVAIDGTIRPVRLGPEVAVGPTKPICAQSTTDAAWLEPGAVVIGAKIPRAIASSGRALVMRVVMSRANGRGRFGVTTSNLRFPLREPDFADVPEGLRVLVPPGAQSATVQLWRGAAGCINSISVAEVR